MQNTQCRLRVVSNKTKELFLLVDKFSNFLSSNRKGAVVDHLPACSVSEIFFLCPKSHRILAVSTHPNSKEAMPPKVVPTLSPLFCGMSCAKFR